MSNKVVIIYRDGNEERRLTLDKERMLIGRDSACEIALEDSAVSRKHAAIINRFEAIYIENISPTGKITKGGETVEYAEMAENEEIQLGPFTLKWAHDEAATQPRETESPPPPEEAGMSLEAPAAPSEAPLLDAESENPATPELAEASAGPIDSSSSNMPAPIEDNENVSSDGKTQIAPRLASARLRVAKGEEIGREIKLDQGSTWIVGRSPQCHIKIENQKLSRQHFRIIKINAVYRLQDLGSAHGTRLNGVSISDAPLQPFDAIQAGPVELQFLLVDASLPATPVGVPMLSHSVTSGSSDLRMEGSNENTAFAAPVPYGVGPTPSQAQNAAPPPQGASSAAAAAAPAAKVSPLLRAREWYTSQPRPRQILIITLLVAGAALGALFLAPGKKAPVVAATDATKEAARAPASAAKEEAVSDDFAKLSPQKQIEVKEGYIKADRALHENRYKDAYDSARKVLDIIKPYKNTQDILDQAAIQINNDSIGLVSKSLTSVKAAKEENQDKLTLLNEEGKKALREKRFSDASEAFLRALALDPTNATATQGLAAATANDASLAIDVPNKPIEVDPEIEEIQLEREELAKLRSDYQNSKGRINSGNYREALPELRDLESKVAQGIEEYTAGRRAPASIRGEMASESRSLLSQIKEAISLAKSQLRIEYQTQFADAEQFTNNRQYVQAREIYDRVVRLEPAFDEPRQLRQKLYVKMLVEARTLYQEALIYESIGDITNAQDGFQRTKDMLASVKDPTAIDYYKKALVKLKGLNKPQ